MDSPTSPSNLSTPATMHDLPAGDIDLSQFSHLLAHTERLATLGTLAAGVAHELSNPVSVMISTTDAIRTESEAGSLSADQLQQFTKVLEENAWRCIRLIQSLRRYSHQQTPFRSNTHPRIIIENAISLVQHHIRHRHLTLRKEISPDLPFVYWDENQITQVLVVLLLNAFDATARIEKENNVLIKAGQDGEGNEIILSVTDNGPGVPPELSARIFEPFFTTKPLGQGTGLGLSIAAGIAQQHRGTLQVSTSKGGGACFTLCLPIGFHSQHGETR